MVSEEKFLQPLHIAGPSHKSVLHSQLLILHKKGVTDNCGSKPVCYSLAQITLTTCACSVVIER